MSTTIKSASDNFQLSMLLYDQRFRALTIQVIFLFCFMGMAVWLVDNTITNLAAKGKDINFSFLGVRAGYDINQRLIDYTNDSSHSRAWLIGLLNTLVLAIVSCITATLIGVTAGVLRLSKNWLVARIMTFYVEAFRNVPLLLWILVIFAVLTEITPAPREFKGLDPTASMYLFDSLAITNRGIYIPTPYFVNSLGQFEFLGLTFNLNFILVLAVLLGSFFVNRRFIRHANLEQISSGIRPVTWWKSGIIILVPITVVLFVFECNLDYPTLKGFNFKGGGYIRNSFGAMWLALSVYTGSYIAENVRGGILAISKGQTEAAFALGIRPTTTTKLVILPQALRVIIPPLISQYLNITKNTSLAIGVGYMDVRATLGGITLNQTGRELECMLLLMATYLVLSLLISAGMNLYNRSVQLEDR
ncbi:MAG: general L-amino acid transport system permease protein [Paracoccaceae bacterium]|jgi:general L-amino acid transport system permease protein